MNTPVIRSKRIDWFLEVKNNPQLLPEALQYFNKEMEEAYDLMIIEGNLGKLISSHAGHFSFYNRLHTQLVHLADHYQTMVKRTRAQVMRDWDINPPTQRKWGPKEITIMMENEPAIMEIEELFQDINYLQDQYGKIIDSFKDRSFRLHNLNELHKAGNGDLEVGD